MSVSQDVNKISVTANFNKIKLAKYNSTAELPKPQRVQLRGLTPSLKDASIQALIKAHPIDKSVGQQHYIVEHL
jgi:hypothetical protein